MIARVCDVAESDLQRLYTPSSNKCTFEEIET
jgi:hypothetical protein